MSIYINRDLEMLEDNEDLDEDVSLCLSIKQDGNRQDDISLVIHLHKKGQFSEILYNFNVCGKMNLYYGL